MEIKVPLKRFVKFVQDAEKLDREYPYLKQCEWLLANWTFDDRSGDYEPLPMPWPFKDGPYLSWWQNARPANL